MQVHPKSEITGLGVAKRVASRLFTVFRALKWAISAIRQKRTGFNQRFLE